MFSLFHVTTACCCGIGKTCSAQMNLMKLSLVHWTRSVDAGLSKTCRDAGTDAVTALMAVDASNAVPSSVPASIDAN